MMKWSSSGKKCVTSNRRESGRDSGVGLEKKFSLASRSVILGLPFPYGYAASSDTGNVSFALGVKKITSFASISTAVFAMFCLSV